MINFHTTFVALAALSMFGTQATPVISVDQTTAMILRAPPLDGDVWQGTLSNDTRQRLEVAQEHLDDASDEGQVFRNDTIMRVNIEREALDLPLIDLSQAFGMPLPSTRPTARPLVAQSNNAEDNREFGYLRSGTMGGGEKRSSSDEDTREFGYLRSGTMGGSRKRSDAEDTREFGYLRSGTMGGGEKRSSNDEDNREFGYLRSGTMGGPRKRSDAEDTREFGYLRSGTMGGTKRSNINAAALYGSLLNRDNLALGAIERVNIAHRVSGKPELTKEGAAEMSADGDAWVANYWESSTTHGGFWTTDQVEGEPNFIEGGQGNGFGFIQSTYHRRHCLANLRMMLAWQITGNGSKMTADMNAHAIHCLEYIQERERANPDLNEEPIDTVDYKGMGIH